MNGLSRPVFYTLAHLEHVGMGMELEPNHTYWFVASFKGSLRDDVHVIPVTRLGETTTGEARIYSEATGWQPMIDPGTQTQQGIAFDIIGYIPLSFSVSYSDIFRDGELIAHGVNQCYYIDENVPHGIHTYTSTPTASKMSITTTFSSTILPKPACKALRSDLAIRQRTSKSAPSR